MPVHNCVHCTIAIVTTISVSQTSILVTARFKVLRKEGDPPRTTCVFASHCKQDGSVDIFETRETRSHMSNMFTLSNMEPLACSASARRLGS